MSAPPARVSPAWPASPLLSEWAAPEPSALARAVAGRRAAGLTVEDCITAPPQEFGFEFSPRLYADAMAAAVAETIRYKAAPLGLASARRAVAAFHGGAATAEQVWLTPGTSFAYFALFRLLARPQGEVLCPSPTYPLFDDLARLAGLSVRRYHLHRQAGGGVQVHWSLDLEEIAFQITPRTCAIVLVSPHNPTGSIASRGELQHLAEAALRAGVPVIYDEVFRTYTAEARTPVPRLADVYPDEGLWLTLNGLSKSHYLPGLKAGWMVAEGDGGRVNRFMAAVEYLADTFLPMPEYTQAALARLLQPEAMAEAERLAALHRHALQTRLAQHQAGGWAADAPEAGPYICCPLPADADPEAAALHLLQRHGVLLHPGSLYGLPEPALVGTIFNPAWGSLPARELRILP